MAFVRRCAFAASKNRAGRGVHSFRAALDYFFAEFVRIIAEGKVEKSLNRGSALPDPSPCLM